MATSGLIAGVVVRLNSSIPYFVLGSKTISNSLLTTRGATPTGGAGNFLMDEIAFDTDWSKATLAEEAEIRWDIIHPVASIRILHRTIDLFSFGAYPAGSRH